MEYQKIGRQEQTLFSHLSKYLPGLQYGSVTRNRHYFQVHMHIKKNTVPPNNQVVSLPSESLKPGFPDTIDTLLDADRCSSGAEVFFSPLFLRLTPGLSLETKCKLTLEARFVHFENSCYRFPLCIRVKLPFSITFWSALDFCT